MNTSLHVVRDDDLIDWLTVNTWTMPMEQRLRAMERLKELDK